MTMKDITPEMCLLAMDGCEPTESMEYTRRFIEESRIVPEWFLEHFTKAERGLFKFEIRHCGQSYERYAVSAADAKNGLRFDLYGRTPENRCAAFEVRQFFPCLAGVIDAFFANRKRLAGSQPRANSLSLNDVRAKLIRLTA